MEREREKTTNVEDVLYQYEGHHIRLNKTLRLEGQKGYLQNYEKTPRTQVQLQNKKNHQPCKERGSPIKIWSTGSYMSAGSRLRKIYERQQRPTSVYDCQLNAL
jgi:hypothetical protein